jgi:hypothetical protein
VQISPQGIYGEKFNGIKQKKRSVSLQLSFFLSPLQAENIKENIKPDKTSGFDRLD